MLTLWNFLSLTFFGLKDIYYGLKSNINVQENDNFNYNCFVTSGSSKTKQNKKIHTPRGNTRRGNAFVFVFDVVVVFQNFPKFEPKLVQI